MAKTAIDKRLDRLYAAALDDFIAERDALAADLREEGESERAADVKRLRKPSVPAWAVNQASRRDPKRIAALIKAGDALRRARGRQQLRAARERERGLVRELGRESERALADAGRPVSAAVREQIEETLHAAALDPEVGETVRRGRVERPGVAVGFPGARASPAAPPPPADAKAERKRDALEKRIGREQHRLADARGKREAAEAKLRDAEREAKAAARELERASRRLKAEVRREAELADGVEKLRKELEHR